MTVEHVSKPVEDERRQVHASAGAIQPEGSNSSPVGSLLSPSRIGGLRAPVPYSMLPLMKPNGFSLDVVLKHLDAVLNSPAFASSRRCQQFLRYVVLENLEGRGDSISERNVAFGVFGKGVNFRAGEDSLVRVKAGEVRRRLAEYYESTPANDIRIELPLGGYAPRIHITGETATESVREQEIANGMKKPFSRRRFAWMAGGALGILGTASLVPMLYRSRTPLDLLWRPVFATKVPLLIFMPILNDHATGEPSDTVGIGPAAALRRAADFLTRHNYPYHLRFGTDLNFSQLREQPSLLLGGFSSKWTIASTRGLRFTFAWSSDIAERAVVDTQTQKTWHTVNPRSDGYADQDYGVLCRLFNADSGQIEMIAGGLTTFGTEGAADVFFSPDVFATLVRQASPHWETKNFEAVIRVSIIGNTPSSPEVVATRFW